MSDQTPGVTTADSGLVWGAGSGTLGSQENQESSREAVSYRVTLDPRCYVSVSDPQGNQACFSWPKEQKISFGTTVMGARGNVLCDLPEGSPLTDDFFWKAFAERSTGLPFLDPQSVDLGTFSAPAGMILALCPTPHKTR